MEWITRKIPYLYGCLTLKGHGNIFSHLHDTGRDARGLKILVSKQTNECCEHPTILRVKQVSIKV